MARRLMAFSHIVFLAPSLIQFSTTQALAIPRLDEPPSLNPQADVPLRIMPLGDSITWGSLSSTGNGYRKALQSLLLASGGKAGSDVDFIGSHTHGDMTDADNEGHSGAFLSEILGFTKLSIDALPNVALIHAGTNDMDFNRDMDTAIDRLEAIIRGVVDGSPGVTVLVARIIFSTDTDMQSRTNTYNKQISQLASDLRSESDKFKIIVVDMSGILTTADLADKKHPNDVGYSKMASAWKTGIDQAKEQGYIISPTKIATGGVGLGLLGSGGNRYCLDSNWASRQEIGTSISNYRAVGVVATGAKDATSSNVLFADVNGMSLIIRRARPKANIEQAMVLMTT